MRLDWTFVARCTACVAVVLAAGLAASIDRSPSASAAASIGEFDDVPLDFADARTRSAFREHQRMLRPDDLPSLLDTCRSEEVYRAEWTPGIVGGDFRIVDVRVVGHQMEVVNYGLVHAPETRKSGGFGWRPTYRMALDAKRLKPVRAGLTAVLRAKLVAATDDLIVDAPRVFIEACRRGRYHYFDRAEAGGADDDPARIVDFAHSILALADRGNIDPGVAKPL
jgi:hypothetical protein